VSATHVPSIGLAARDALMPRNRLIDLRVKRYRAAAVEVGEDVIYRERRPSPS
jgi:hypothetical protein